VVTVTSTLTTTTTLPVTIISSTTVTETQRVVDVATTVSVGVPLLIIGFIIGIFIRNNVNKAITKSLSKIFYFFLLIKNQNL